MNSKKRIVSAAMGIAIAAVMIFVFDEGKKEQPVYRVEQGKVFGTYYTIRYEAASDLKDSLSAAFAEFDASLSMFNPRSTLSAINANRDTTTDAFFESMFAEAERVWRLSGGAFDISVAPMVNYWGFGTRARESRAATTEAQIDSLRAFVGFEKIQLVNHRIVKSDPRVMLDAGAVAKGQACDVVAAMLARNGCTNYLVEIGGEIVCRGVNAKGEKWHIGITKPVEGTSQHQSLQEVLAVSDLKMATSGNYRNFYYDKGERRSHTIDPRTGRPVVHSLLSATVVSSSCMRADALATACMVLGAEEALDLIRRANEEDKAQGSETACYLIIAQGDTLNVATSPNWTIN